MSDILYTKNGRPLQFDGDSLWSKSGTYVGPVIDDLVYDKHGKYAGTVVGDRVIYRQTDSASVTGPTSVAGRAGAAVANAVGTAEWGDEPSFPD